MALCITSVENHREREKGFIVYPVFSRRSGGLSLGINLYPGKKYCPFNCPYCEVFPFANDAVFSLEQMEKDLRCAVNDALEQNAPISDICFSGNGEPSLSPFFGDALKIAENIRAQIAPPEAQNAAHGTSQGAAQNAPQKTQLVVITNGAGLLQPPVFSMLQAASGQTDIWLKLDAGTPGWYQKINRSSLPFEKLIGKIKEFTACASVTIQTMLCAINGSPPPDEEAQAWESLVCELAAAGSIRKVQIYGKARPAPEDPTASPLPSESLEERAASLRCKFVERGISTPVDVYV